VHVVAGRLRVFYPRSGNEQFGQAYQGIWGAVGAANDNPQSASICQAFKLLVSNDGSFCLAGKSD
jgi:predicted carbohydrate-binding protein with CBM5 and CBM33 domain